MTQFIRTLAGVVVVAAAACGEGIDVDEVPVGSEVAVTREDGGVVQGTLTERDPAVVKISAGRTVREVPRADIAVVQVVEESEPLTLPPAAKFTEHTIPAGTTLPVRLTTGVDSKTARVGQAVSGVLTEALVVDGVAVVPAGTAVSGTVTAVEAAGKVKGRASLALAFRTMTVEGHDAPYSIDADRSFVAASTKKEDAERIAVPAVAGAVIGGILGGKKGAVIGGAVGGGAGTAVVLTTTGDEVSLAAGTALNIPLDGAVTVRVPITRG